MKEIIKMKTNKSKFFNAYYHLILATGQFNRRNIDGTLADKLIPYPIESIGSDKFTKEVIDGDETYAELTHNGLDCTLTLIEPSIHQSLHFTILPIQYFRQWITLGMSENPLHPIILVQFHMDIHLLVVREKNNDIQKVMKDFKRGLLRTGMEQLLGKRNSLIDILAGEYSWR